MWVKPQKDLGEYRYLYNMGLCKRIELQIDDESKAITMWLAYDFEKYCIARFRSLGTAYKVREDLIMASWNDRAFTIPEDI